MLRSADLVTR